MQDIQGEDRMMLVADLIATLHDRLAVMTRTLSEAQARNTELVTENRELREDRDSLANLLEHCNNKRSELMAATTARDTVEPNAAGSTPEVSS